MPITRSYSLPEDVVKVIDALPKNERSKFVASTLRRAVQNQSKKKALDVLDSIVPIQDDDKRSSVELLKASRKERNEHLSNNNKK